MYRRFRDSQRLATLLIHDAPKIHRRNIQISQYKKLPSITPSLNFTFKELDFTNVKDRLKRKNGIIVDVRDPDEVANGSIPGAYNIPVSDMENAFTALDAENFQKSYGLSKPSTSEELIVYCRSGKRASEAYGILEKQGFKSVFLYRGSWNDWVEKGGDKA